MPRLLGAAALALLGIAIIDGGISFVVRERKLRKIEREESPRKPSGFSTRFARAVRNEFLKPKGSESFTSLVDMRSQFKAWLASYNQSPLEGFPNYGLSPIEIFTKAKLAAA